jgi:hypothetical protein
LRHPKKELHHGRAVCRVEQHGYGKLANNLVVASLEGDGQGLCGRFIFYFVNCPSKNLISKLMDFFYIFTSS